MVLASWSLQLAVNPRPCGMEAMSTSVGWHSLIERRWKGRRGETGGVTAGKGQPPLVWQGREALGVSRLSQFIKRGDPTPGQPLLSPLIEIPEQRGQQESFFGEFVIDVRWHHWVDRAQDQTVFFQFTQLFRQKPGSDSRHVTVELVEPQLSFQQMEQDHALPFPGDDRGTGFHRATG